MVLTYIEQNGSQLHEQSLAALTLARELAGGGGLTAVLIGSGLQPLAGGLAEYGVQTAVLVEDDRLAVYAPEAYAAALAQLARERSVDLMLAAGTDRGNELMAHVGAILGQPLAANCTAVTLGDPTVVTRVRWGGSLLEEASLTGSPLLLTAAPLTFTATPAPASGFSMESFPPQLTEKQFRVRVTGSVPAAAGKVSLADARLVVGGGRGVGSADGFAVLDELAGLLGGAVGGSRVVTNLGWRPHADQVGQTGTRIAPDLYIACGISGAIQHWVGCKGSKVVLAINTDPEAPIIAKADYTVIGDMHEVLPALIAELRK